MQVRVIGFDTHSDQLTMQNALLALDPKLALVPRAGLVHRLDKDTSGLLLVARTPEAHTRLVAAMAAREITREYLVLTGVSAEFVAALERGEQPTNPAASPSRSRSQ